MSLLDSVGSLGNVGAWFRGWHKSNFDMSSVGHVGRQKFDAGQTKWRGRNSGVSEK